MHVAPLGYTTSPPFLQLSLPSPFSANFYFVSKFTTNLPGKELPAYSLLEFRLNASLHYPKDY